MRPSQTTRRRWPSALQIQATFLLGNALKHAGKSRHALDAYNEALNINPESTEAQTAIIELNH